MNDKIKEAVYVAACAAAFYSAAKHLKKDVTVAVVLGTALGKIFATPINTTT